MYFIWLVVAMVGIGGWGSVRAQEVKSPLRLRLDTNFLINVLNSHNADIFKNFTNINITKEDDPALEHCEIIWFTFVPAEGKDLLDFRMNYEMKSNYIGFHTDRIIIKGNATLKDGSSLKFKAPVPYIKWNANVTFLKLGDLMNGTPLRTDKIYY
jgi:hypothetical protein